MFRRTSRSYWCVSRSKRVDGKRTYKTQTTGPLAMLAVLLLGSEAVEFWGVGLEASGAILGLLEH